MRVVVAVFISALLLLTDTAAAAPSVSLQFAARPDASAKWKRATLDCDTKARGTGWMRRDAASRCKAARRLARFMASAPDPDRICTLQYGGPDEFRARGHVGGRRINRIFTLRDGCEIADFRKVKSLWKGSGVSAPGS